MNNFVLKSIRLVWLIFLAFPGIAPAQEPLPFPATHTFQELVAELVDLRKETASERLTWKEQKKSLRQEYALLLKEKELLESEIQDAKENKSAEEKERIQLFRDKEGYQKALDEALPALSRAEVVLKRWRKILPVLFSEPLHKSFDKLERTQDLSFSERLQLILSLWSEIERLQHTVNVAKEILEIEPGKRKEFETIYLGLVQGYCVSADEKLAGTGKPGAEGWKWEWHPQIAGNVRQAIDCHRQKRTAQFIRIPLEIEAKK